MKVTISWKIRGLYTVYNLLIIVEPIASIHTENRSGRVHVAPGREGRGEGREGREEREGRDLRGLRALLAAHQGLEDAYQ